MKRIFFLSLICLMVTSCALVADTSKPYSLEFARSAGEKDCSATVKAPPGGSLFSVWTKVPNMSPHDYSGDSDYDWIHHNMTVYVLKGTNWYVWALVGNVRRSPGGYVYNANTMLFIGDTGAYAGDYSYYQMAQADEVPFSTVSGWVWVAWQVVVNADNSMIFRQWLKFGPEGKVFKAWESGKDSASLDAIRTYARDNGKMSAEEAAA